MMDKINDERLFKAILKGMRNSGSEGLYSFLIGIGGGGTAYAVIRILREDCYGNRIQPYNYKKTLIHELLHLKLCLLGESGNDLQDRYVHQLIDDLARAFADAEGERK